MGQTIQQHVHRTVILCSQDEVKAVFDLCQKEYFDDYVLVWPHTYDGPRLAMTRKIKAMPHLAAVQVIMMTGDARKKALASSVDAGAAAFVVKPFTRESLLGHLDKALLR